MDEAVFSKQTVEFICQTNGACQGVKWLKDGKPLAPHKIYKKYEMKTQFSTQHTLIVHDVTMFDQGIYTFKVIEMGAKIKTDIQSSRGASDNPISPRSPGDNLPVFSFDQSNSERNQSSINQTINSIREIREKRREDRKNYLYRLNSVE